MLDACSSIRPRASSFPRRTAPATLSTATDSPRLPLTTVSTLRISLELETLRSTSFSRSSLPFGRVPRSFRWDAQKCNAFVPERRSRESRRACATGRNGRSREPLLPEPAIELDSERSNDRLTKFLSHVTLSVKYSEADIAFGCQAA